MKREGIPDLSPDQGPRLYVGPGQKGHTVMTSQPLVTKESVQGQHRVEERSD